MNNALKVRPHVSETPVRVLPVQLAPHPNKIESSVAPIPEIRVSGLLRKAAERMRKKGFTEEFGDSTGPACFIGTISFVLRGGKWTDPYSRQWHAANDFVQQLIFNNDPYCFDEEYLFSFGWNTKDAAAALDLAADYAEAIGK